MRHRTMFGYPVIESEVCQIGQIIVGHDFSLSSNRVTVVAHPLDVIALRNWDDADQRLLDSSMWVREEIERRFHRLDVNIRLSEDTDHD
jgi:hypothetical protein